MPIPRFMSSVENPSIAPIWARVSTGGGDSKFGARLGSEGATELPIGVVVVAAGAGVAVACVVLDVLAAGAGFAGARAGDGAEGGGGGGSCGGAPCSIA